MTALGETLRPAFDRLCFGVEYWTPIRGQHSEPIDTLFRPEVRAAYAELVAMGWTDAIRLLHPDERIYTFWKYFRNAFARDAGLRIDHFLLSPSLRERLAASGVDKFARAWEHTSDHAPTWIELEDG
jgi:exodeoxyribonuclease-3